MNNQTQITPEMLIFIAGIFSLFLIGFTLVIREMVKAMSKDDQHATSTKKPPLGVIPKWLHDELVREKRMKDLSEAIERYVDANLTPNEAWINEYNELVLEHKKSK